MGETPFNESNALLVVIRGDDGEARRILETMTRGEIGRLADYLVTLDGLCGSVWRQKAATEQEEKSDG